jgi:hypothetical protein
VQSVIADTRIAVPAEVVWTRISDFTSWHLWIPRIVGTVMDPAHHGDEVGAIRTLTLSDGNTVRERLTLKDPVQRRIGYEYPDGLPFPVTSYQAQVRVESDGSVALVRWSSEFEASDELAAQITPTFTGLYQTYLANLAESFD